MRESLHNAMEVFGKAVEITSAEERASWLDDVCGDNTRLRAEVEQLMEAHNAAGDFMKQPAVAHDQPVSTNAKQDAPRLPDRYRLVSEAGRGGMGVVWRVVDDHFGRPLAVKVMLAKLVDVPQAIARFERESRLTGILQHPAIPPVVDCGRLEDQTPFFSMKLVEGQTLAHLMAERSDTENDLPRLLGIFEQVCQAVGYAHSQGVIHRDLKPANIMVGAFGEVQVMDWGMAKRTSSRSRAESVTDTPETVSLPTNDLDGRVAETITYSEPRDTSVEKTALQANEAGGQAPGSQEQEDLTREGNVLGTLAYMSPEQARGEIDSLDARSDVFALGAILYEILVRMRLYPGPNIWEVASQAGHADAFELLDQSGVEVELIKLCKHCLTAEPVGRPPNGSAVAEAIRKYDDNLQERLTKERAEHAAAEARMEEERKRARLERSKRRISVGLAAAMMLLLVGGGAAAWWYRQAKIDEERAAAARAVKTRQTIEQARRDIELSLDRAAKLRDSLRFQAAKPLLDQAWDRLPAIPKADILAERIEQSKSDLEMARRLDAIRLRKSSWLKNGFDKEFSHGPEGAYALAFREYGIKIFGDESAEELGKQISATQIARALVSALDDWGTDDRNSAQRVLKIAREADRDPFRNRLRDPAVWGNTKVILELAERTNPASLSPSTLRLVAAALKSSGELAAAADLLTRAITNHPGDVWLRLAAADIFGDKAFWKPLEAIEHYSAAVAIRPDGAQPRCALASLLNRAGRTNQAEAVFRAAVRADPTSALARTGVGHMLHLSGRLQEAETSLRRAIEVDPEFPWAHTKLSDVLVEMGREPEAELVLRKTIAAGSKDAFAYCGLGIILAATDRRSESEAAFRRAIELDPTHAIAHSSLAHILHHTNRTSEAETAYRRAIEIDPNYAQAHCGLGELLKAMNRLRESQRAFQRAVEVDPKFARAHNNLGLLNYEGGRPEEAETAYRRAIEVDPEFAPAHHNLGDLLKAAGRSKEAEAAYRRAIDVDPEFASAHHNLGNLLKAAGRLKEAEASYRRAIELDPHSYQTYFNLGTMLANQTDRFAEAVEVLKRGHALGSARKDWSYPSAKWVAAAERRLALDQKLSAIRNGEPPPEKLAEALALADFAFMRKRQPQFASTLFQPALNDPGLSRVPAELRFKYQYNAGCAAVLCADGKVEKGADSPNVEEAAQLRHRALAHLHASLGAWKSLMKDPKFQAVGTEPLEHWLSDPDLESVRGRSADLPQSERDGWHKLWQEVADLLHASRHTNPNERSQDPGQGLR